MAQPAREHTSLSLAFAATVRAERGVRRLSQVEAARACNLPTSTYRRIETEERVADVPQLSKIAHGFGMAASELMRRSEARLDEVMRVMVDTGGVAAVLADVADVELRLRLEQEAAGDRHAEVNGE